MGAACQGARNTQRKIGTNFCSAFPKVRRQKNCPMNRTPKLAANQQPAKQRDPDFRERYSLAMEHRAETYSEQVDDLVQMVISGEKYVQTLAGSRLMARNGKLRLTP